MSEAKRVAYICPVCDKLVPKEGDDCLIPGHYRAKPRRTMVVEETECDYWQRRAEQAEALLDEIAQDQNESSFDNLPEP